MIGRSFFSHAADFTPVRTTEMGRTSQLTAQFSIVADADLTIAKQYDMIQPSESETATVRSVFIIDTDNKIRLTMTYPMNVGRNFDEILRVIDALQTGDKHKTATPADWVPGQQVIIPPSVSEVDAKAVYSPGFEALRPYLRTVKLSERPLK